MAKALATPIRFRFDQDKFLAVLAMLSTNVQNLDVLKAIKLLYLIDRNHLRKFGKPVLGDTYLAMKLGPVPYQSYQILDDIGHGNKRKLPFSAESRRGSDYPVFRATAQIEYEFLLSQAETETICGVMQEFGSIAAIKLSDLTHEHAAWKQVWHEKTPNKQIDYRLFFVEHADKCKDALEAMLLEQED